jgi:hypothetical protein
MVNERFAQRLWISFGIIVASIALAAGALYFFSGDLSANANAIVNARAALDEQAVAVANLASLKQQATQAAQYQAAISQLVPGQYGLVTFTQWFADQGKKYSVSANAAFQGAAVPAQGAAPGTAAFSFTAAGSLDGLTSFLDFIGAKSSEFLVSFNSFNVTGDGTNYSVTGQGTVFSQ